MAKTKRILSLFVVALMTVFTVLSYVPAKAATAAPKLSVVAQPAAEYTKDDTISFTVNAHYAGKVMYRVILYNGTTKTTSNLWYMYPGSGYYYTKWTPSGTMDFNIHWLASQLQPGYYSMTVLAKKVGSKAKYDTYVDTHSFKIVEKTATISSIADVTAAVDEGGAYTLPATVSAKMSDDTTKDVAVVWTPATVDTTKVGDQAYVGKVEGYDKDVKLTLTVKAVPLAVTSVSANNLKTINVVFSKKIDEDTLSKITVTNKDIIDRGLLEDGKTAVIVLKDNVAQSTTLEVKVDGVKSADGKETVEDFAKKIVAVDKDTPQLLSATALNAKQVELQFNEPVNGMDNPLIFKTYTNIKIDGVSVIAQSAVDYINNTVVLTLPTVKAPKTYKLEVSSIADFAGFKIDSKEFDLVVAEDKAAPKLISAEVKDLNTIVVNFDEKLDAIGTIKVNGTKVSAVEEVAKSAGKQFKLTLAKSLDLGAVVEIQIQYSGQKDVVGNKVDPEATYSFNIKDDTTIPTVTLEVKAGNKVVLTFSKPMLSVGYVTLLNKDSKKVATVQINTLTFKANTNNTVLEIAASKLGLDNVEPADYTLVVSGMKDATVRANPLPEQKIAFKSLDTKLPVVTPTYFVQKDDKDSDYDTVTFYFNEAMDADTLKNLSNYVIGTKSFAAIDGVDIEEVSSDNESITFYYPDAYKDLIGTIRVYALKDAAGNMIANGYADVTRLTSTALNIVSVKAASVDTVKVTFNTQIASIDPSAFVIKEVGKDVPYTTFVAASLDSKGTTATLTVNPYKEIGADAYNYNLVVNDNEAIENVYGENLDSTIKTIAITDAISPAIDTVAQNTDDNDVAINNEILVTFTEPVNLEPSEIKLRDEDGVVIPTNKYTVKQLDPENYLLTLDADEEDTITVQFGMPVPAKTADLKGNTLVAYDFSNVTLTVEKKTSSADQTAADLKAVADDKAALVPGFAAGDTATSVTNNIILPATGANGSIITWTSNNAAVVANDGKVTRPAFGTADAYAALTATIRKGAAVDTKTFNVVVKVLTEGTDAEKVAADKAALAITYAVGDNANSVTDDITLTATGLNGSTITWASDNATAITIAGIVTRPISNGTDAVVTLTATITSGEETTTKVFTVVVKRNLTDAEKVAADKAALAITFADGDNANSVTDDITLPTAGLNGSTITWTSDNTTAITTAGIVTRPADADATVNLTATITVGTVNDTKDFTVIVMKDLTDAEKVAADKAALAITFADGDNANSVTKDITLPANGLNDSDITWLSTNTAVLGSDGKIGTVPTATEGDKTVTLIATITIKGVSDQKSFTVTVKAANPTNTELLNLDNAALNLVYATGDTKDSVTNNITLPSKGANGTTITWASNNTTIISNDGTVTRPTGADVTVTLTATLKNNADTKGEVSNTKLFTVVVKAN